MHESCKVLVVYSLLFYFIPSFNTIDNIAPGQSIKDDETLISADGSFELGFFSGRNSLSRFMGIWYKNMSSREVVWVANRDVPLRNSSGVLQVTDGGILVILDDKGAPIWSSNASTTAEKPVAQLMDSGNLVVKDGNNPENLLWQSFDYPCDTLLPGMKLRSSIITGMYMSLTSWRNTDDPTPGEFSSHIDTRGLPQLVMTKGATLLYRQGSWNGILFTGVPWKTLSKYFNFSFVLTELEVYYEYGLLDSSMVTRYMLHPSGLVQRFIWSDRTQSWELFAIGPVDQCDNYAFCGANSYCNISKSPICECLRGFIPKSQENWNSSTSSDGCVRRVNLDCDNIDGFLKYPGMKLPDTSSSWFDKNINLEECEKLCLKNCSCTAYANLDVRDGGSGCLLWFGNIMDVKKQTSEGQDLYIRVAASELDQNENNSHLNKKQLIGILVGSATFVMGMIILGVPICLRMKKLKKRVDWKNKIYNMEDQDREKEDFDIPTFDLSTIVNATNHFSLSNKLGEGGFGPVYKGTLKNGQEIAVKQLSKNSGQGPEEFKTEAVLIAKLQHRNLVRLLGCCIQYRERLLIYEFMPNKSLDYFIFDKARSNLLHWMRRFHIISGIARGLLYLHEDSRLKIIHRDLKTSNILLDNNMNPKISDFGLARILGEDQAEAKTKRVMGTYGYMPPEYAVRGYFSVKSDVFSFGVIVIEIVSGRQIREFSDPHHGLNLLGHAWRLWTEERPLELIDESLGESITQADVLRCIHIGLLCVQDRPEDRPDMSSLVLMLNGDKPLPKSKQPAFYPHQFDSSSGSYKLYSTNEISVISLDAR